MDLVTDINSKVEPSAGIAFVPEIGKKIPITFNYTKHSRARGLRKMEIESFYKTLIGEIKNLKVGTKVDVGCGEGYTLDRIIKEKIGKNYIGIDNSPTAINLGKELFPGVNLQVADIYQLSLADNSSDLVICTEVLEHLDNPFVALKEIIRVSKKYLVLSVPNEPFFSLRNILRGKHLVRLGNTPGHVNQWTSSAFKKLLIQNQLRILKIKHPFPFTLVAAEKTLS